MAGIRRRWLQAAAWIAPAFIALSLSAYRSALLPLWSDEYATSAHAALDVPDLLSAIGHVDAVFGPYYLLMHLLVPVLGAEAGLRVPSLIAFCIATALVGVIASRWWGAWAALAAGTAFAVNLALLAQAASARPYTLSVMFLLAAVLMFDVAMSGAGRRRLWVGGAVASALAVAMHLFAILALAATATLLLGRHRAARSWALAVAPSVAVAGIMGIAGASHRGQISWIPAPGLDDVVTVLVNLAGLGVSRSLPVGAAMLPVLLVIFALALVADARAASDGAHDAAAHQGRLEQWRPVLFSGVILVVPWTILVIGSWVMTPMLRERYLIWSAAGAAFVVGAGVHVWVRFGSAVSVTAGILAIALLGPSSAFSIWRIAHLQPAMGDMEQVVDRLRDEAAADDRIAVVQRYWEGGVRRELAAALDDESYTAEVIERLPAGAQPLVEVRRITSADPMRTEPDSGVPRAGDVIWLVRRAPLTDEELEGIDPRVAACLRDVASGSEEQIGGYFLTRTVCSHE